MFRFELILLLLDLFTHDLLYLIGLRLAGICSVSIRVVNCRCFLFFVFLSLCFFLILVIAFSLFLGVGGAFHSCNLRSLLVLTFPLVFLMVLKLLFVQKNWLSMLIKLDKRSVEHIFFKHVELGTIFDFKNHVLRL